jgi:methionyl-tRNA formyltransferase
MSDIRHPTLKRSTSDVRYPTSDLGLPTSDNVIDERKAHMTGIVVFLNGDRGLAVLKAVLDSGRFVSAVVTPKNKSSALLQNILAEREIAHFPIADVNSVESIEVFRAKKPSVFLIAGFSTIFRPPLLDVPRLGTLNLHAGRLPQYRGGSPLNWQLINGESEAGISVIQVDPGIDTGPVMSEATIRINANDTIADLHDRANALFPELVLKALERIENGAPGRAQGEENARYWHQRNDADGKLFFRDMTADQMDRMIRALTAPYPGAWCLYQNRRVRVLSAKIPGITLKGSPGRICCIQGEGPYVVCADKGILLTEYVIEEGHGEKLRHGQYLL